MEEDETALDLAELACRKLLDRFENQKIDFILYCTQSPEYFLPSTSCILQQRVGLSKDIGSLDFNLGCSGYTYGLSIAKGLIETGLATNVLLVTAETYSKYINKRDKANLAIFGDAASATLIRSNDKVNGIRKFLFG